MLDNLYLPVWVDLFVALGMILSACQPNHAFDGYLVDMVAFLIPTKIKTWSDLRNLMVGVHLCQGSLPGFQYGFADAVFPDPASFELAGRWEGIDLATKLPQYCPTLDLDYFYETCTNLTAVYLRLTN